MIKYWISGGRSVLHVSKADYQNGAINMLRASSFSSASHNPKVRLVYYGYILEFTLLRYLNKFLFHLFSLISEK